jgi:hypothetical protein
MTTPRKRKTALEAPSSDDDRRSDADYDDSVEAEEAGEAEQVAEEEEEAVEAKEEMHGMVQSALKQLSEPKAPRVKSRSRPLLPPLKRAKKLTRGTLALLS